MEAENGSLNDNFPLQTEENFHFHVGFRERTYLQHQNLLF